MAQYQFDYLFISLLLLHVILLHYCESCRLSFLCGVGSMLALLKIAIILFIAYEHLNC